MVRRGRVFLEVPISKIRIDQRVRKCTVGWTKTRNDLSRDVGESYYSHFLTGDQVTDKIFFDMKPNTVAGPFQGPHGYYIVYLKSRRAPTNPLRLNDEKHVNLLKEDYLRVKFTEYAHDSLINAEIEGL